MGQELLLDAHDADHMHQVLDRTGYLVRNEGVIFDNIVLQLQVFERLDHLLDLAAHLRRVFVLELLDSNHDIAAPFRQVLILVFATPVTVAGKEL